MNETAKAAFESKKASFDEKMHCGINFDSVKKEFLYGGRVEAVCYFLNGFGNGELQERLIEFMIGNALGVQALAQKERDFFLLALPSAETSAVKEENEALSAVYCGNTVVLVCGYEDYIVADTKKYPARSIEEPPKDKVLRGSRDGFTESILPNSALIRRRIRDPRLIFRHVSVGRSSRTDVLVCYVRGVADEAFAQRLIRNLSALQTESVHLGHESLTELLIGKKWYNPFPKVRYTERPDAAAAMLSEGSVIVLCDNYPAAMVLPTSIFDFLQDTDDFYFSPVIGGYMKLVRNVVFLLSLLLTPVWYTLQSYPALLPQSLSFLLYKGESFLPLLLQLLLVEIAVDGLKLASLNTPDTLSNSLSVISALILGDFAIGVGWLSEQVILYMSFVAIANFTQPSYELGYAFKFFRLLTLVLIRFFSVWGLVAGILLTIAAIATNNALDGGRGYLYPLVPFNARALFRLFFRARLKNENCLQMKN